MPWQQREDDEGVGEGGLEGENADGGASGGRREGDARGDKRERDGQSDQEGDRKATIRWY